MVGTLLQQIANALTLGSLYALIALGYTMIYGILRLINFAHGDVFMLGSYFGLYTAQVLIAAGLGAADGQQTPWQFALNVLVAMALCGAIGALIERVAYRPLRRSPKLSALITAIGVSLLIEYLAQIRWDVPAFNLLGLHFAGGHFFGPDPQSYPQLVHASDEVAWVHRLLRIRIAQKDLLVLGTTLLTLLVLRFFVQYTRTGKAMRAVSQSYDASRLMGIDLNRIISFTFILGSALAALGGCLYGLQYGTVKPLLGITVGLKAFVAAVLGGIGNIPGAALGGVVLAGAEVLVASLGYAEYRDAIAFIILILVLMVRPEGMLGKAVPEKV